MGFSKTVSLMRCYSSKKFRFRSNYCEISIINVFIQIKDAIEKNRFFTNLDNQLDSFPKDICKNKILPQLVTAFEFSAVGSAILGPLFKVYINQIHEIYC